MGGVNWFRKHVNWIAGLIGLGWNILLLLKSIETGDTEITFGLKGAIEATFYLIFFLPIYGWAVAQKGRSLWWSLTFLIPLGWITFLKLENRRMIFDVKDGKIIKRRSDTND